jgi:Transposase IS116/IS110/IS902 family
MLAHGLVSALARAESAGKRLSGRCKKGNRSVREVLVQAAHGVRRSHTYLGERYRRKIKTARQ